MLQIAPEWTEFSPPIRASSQAPRMYGIPVDAGVCCPYLRMMDPPHEFEWDFEKAKSNLAKHRVPFEFAMRLFADPDRVEFDVSVPEQGEMRRKAVGLIDGKLYVVVHTMRSDPCRLISARRANAKEEKLYAQDDP